MKYVKCFVLLLLFIPLVSAGDSNQEEDTTPPYSDFFNPPANVIDDFPIFSIMFNLHDTESGVDISTLELELNRREVEYWYDGDPSYYIVVTRDQYGFPLVPWGKRAFVSYSVKDFAGNEFSNKYWVQSEFYNQGPEIIGIKSPRSPISGTVTFIVRVSETYGEITELHFQGGVGYSEPTIWAWMDFPCQTIIDDFTFACEIDSTFLEYYFPVAVRARAKGAQGYSFGPMLWSGPFVVDNRINKLLK